jgi:hypothetical protein
MTQMFAHDMLSDKEGGTVNREVETPQLIRVTAQMAGAEPRTGSIPDDTDDEGSPFSVPRISEITMEMKAFQVTGCIATKQNGETVVVHLLPKDATADQGSDHHLVTMGASYTTTNTTH